MNLTILKFKMTSFDFYIFLSSIMVGSLDPHNVNVFLYYWDVSHFIGCMGL